MTSNGSRKTNRNPLGNGSLGVFWLVAVMVSGGCSIGKRFEPVSITNRTLGTMKVAVAPAINQSGSASFDPNRFADLMASELSHAEGISVIPVSRVLGALASEGRTQVASPAHAYELLGRLGADAILVFAVTEYDPYDPPTIGITAQLYGSGPESREGTLDPVALSRRTTLPASQEPRATKRLLAQTQRVFDASHKATVADIRAFAEKRNGEDSPFGWRKYVVSQQHYIRYCCHATVRALLNETRDAEPTGRVGDRMNRHERDSTIVVGKR